MTHTVHIWSSNNQHAARLEKPSTFSKKVRRFMYVFNNVAHDDRIETI